MTEREKELLRVFVTICIVLIACYIGQILK